MRNLSNQSSQVFDEMECQQSLSKDLNGAAGRILIVSAYATVHGIERWRTHFEKATNRGVSVCVLIQEPRHWSRRRDGTLPAAEDAKLKLVDAAVELLQSLGIHVTLRQKMHEKLIVIDDRILWEGSMNVLSWFNTTERYRRFSDRAEVQQAIQKHKLLPCNHCVVPTVLQVLNERRVCLGLKQQDVAGMARIHRKLVLEWESGKRDVRLGTLERICGALGCEVQIIPKHMGQTIRRLVRESLSQAGKRKNCTWPTSNQCSGPTIPHLLTGQRLSLGLTQQDVATMVGVHRKLVRECETGKRDMWLGTLERICDALGFEVQVIPKHLGQTSRRLACSEGQSKNSM